MKRMRFWNVHYFHHYPFFTILFVLLLCRVPLFFRLTTQIVHFRTRVPERYLLHYGIREIWIIHPNSRIDIQSSVKQQTYSCLVPFYFAAAFDHQDFNNVSSLLGTSRKFSTSTTWLLEERLTNLTNNPVLADAYGGWQSHLYCWERIHAFARSTSIDRPSVIIEDDVQLTPAFLHGIKAVLANAASDWSIISLKPSGSFRYDRRHSFGTISPSFGPIYIVRNASVAQALYELNNNQAPSLFFSGSKQKLTGWKPITSDEFSLYSMSCDGIRKKRRKTSHPHAVVFTPL